MATRSGIKVVRQILADYLRIKHKGKKDEKIFKQKRTNGVLLHFLSPSLAALIGIYGWSSNEWLTPFIVIVPILWGRAQSRLQAFFVMFAYYFAASRDIIPGAYVFFQDGDALRAFFLWFGSSIALSFPWTVFAISRDDRFLTCFVKVSMAISLCAVPPIGLFGWVNPILVAGVYFPGFGFAGFLVMALLWCICLKIRNLWRYCILVIVLATTCAISLRSDSLLQTPEPPRDFIGINTELGQFASGSGDSLSGYERMKMVFENLYERREELKKFKNIVLPETICGTFFSDTARDMWASEAKRFLGEGMTLFFGAELMTEITDEGIRYDNAIFSIGEESIRYAQRIPVPFSMYRPWENAGANAYIFTPQKMQLVGINHVGIIICYEQFLTWSWLLMLAEGVPDVVICTANNWWSRSTSLPTIQKRSRELWSRLFWIPVISAGNI